MAQSDTVAVIGLGKIGLALAGFYARAGCRVIGCDVVEERTTAVADGYIAVAEPGLREALLQAGAEGRLKTTTDAAEAVRQAANIVIVVPVTASGPAAFDTSALDRAAAAVADAVKPGALVILETTVPVGTTRRVLAEPIRRRAHGDVFVAYSPERVSVGRIFDDLRAYPKIVGGVDASSTERAVAFYRRVLAGAAVTPVGSLETAEFVKLIETSYRYVNIALANEFALAAEGHGVDVSMAIAAANSQPYSHIHTPGVGVGGTCIPVYPFFFEAGAPDAVVVPAARQVNDGMPEHVCVLLERALGSLRGRSVILLGVAFRPGVKESANSPVFPIASLIAAHGGLAEVFDPLYEPNEIRKIGLVPADLTGQYDAAVLVTAHESFLDVGVLERIAPRVALDGRNAWRRTAVEALGIRYVGIGR